MKPFRFGMNVGHAYSRSGLVEKAHKIESLGERLRGSHSDLRSTFFADPSPRPMGGPRKAVLVEDDADPHQEAAT
jgi:hypothetical protein